MADDLEDVSVVETTEATTSAETTQVATPVVVEVEPSGEPSTPADERVFTPSTKIGTAEDYNRQQVAEENGVALGNGGVDGRTVTQAGQNAKAAAEEDRKSELLEQIQQAEARRKDFLDKEHDFGGMRMSGHDLAKLIDFISNPQMQDKLRERLGKSGVPKDKIDKGMKELNEYIELKKKEQEGGKLTEEQQRRLKELEKSEEFKIVAQHTVRIAQEYGVPISPKMGEAQVSILATSSDDNSSREQKNIKSDQIIVQASSTLNVSQEDDMLEIDTAEAPKRVAQSTIVPVAFVAASAKESFSGAPHLTEKFSVSSALPTPSQSNGPNLATDNDPTNRVDGTELSSVAMTTKMPLAVVAARA